MAPSLMTKSAPTTNARGTMINQNKDAFVALIDPRTFSAVTNKLRSFFLARGFVEAHTQNRLSIMAACEDPHTIAAYEYGGTKWPLPQTGQMWLEHELLSDKTLDGVFCLSTSYRQEPNPIAGRHHRIFPMFEFELKGGFDKLVELAADLVEYLGFKRDAAGDYPGGNYEDVAREFNTSILESDDELSIQKKYGEVFFLQNFPERTSPFWNMKRRADGTACKLDVLLHGMETIGSAERSCDAEEQRHAFLTIENGGYAQRIFDLFGRERVERELNDFLSFDFFQRSGGGIGLTRLIRAMKANNLL